MILYSYSARIGYAQAQQAGFAKSLGRGAKHPPAVFEERLHAEHVLGPASEASLSAFLAARYRPEGLRVVVAADTPALEFLARHRQEICPGVPIVYSAPMRVPDALSAPGEAVTGVLEVLSPEATLATMRSLFPAVRRVVVVATSNPQWGAINQQVGRSIDGSGLASEWLTELPLEAQLQRVARATPDEAVLLLRSNPGPEARTGRLAPDDGDVLRVSARPVFCLYAGGVMGGALGGVVASGERYGEVAGAMAMRVVNGEDVRSIPPIMGANVPMFNWDQVRRWNIDLARLPPGSVLLNRERTWFEKSALLIAAFSLIGAAQTAAIVGLMVARRWARTTAAELARSRDSLTLLTENLPGVVYSIVKSRDGKHLLEYASGGMERLLGPSFAAEVRARPEGLYERMDALTLTRLNEASEAAAQKGIPVDTTCRLLLPDGREVWVRCIAEVSPLPDGSMQRRGLILDVTSQMKAEEAQRESDLRCRLALSVTSDAVWDLDVTSGTMLWSEGYFRTFWPTLSPGPLRVEECGSRVHPDDRDAMIAGFLRALEDGSGERRASFRYQRSDGSYAHVEDRGVIIRDAQGRAVRAIGAMTDVSERIESERRVRESEQRLRDFTENARDVLWVTDATGERLEYLSPAFGGIWGFDPGPSDAPRADLRASVMPQDRAIFDAARAQIADKGYEAQYRIVRPDGGVRWIRDRAYPVRDHLGRVYRVAGIAEDVTEARRAQDALARTMRVQELLLSELDHRVKNALTGLLTLVDQNAAGAASVQDFAASIGGRIATLATVHTMLSATHWDSLPLASIIRSVAPGHLRAALELHGPQTLVQARQATALAMSIQELFTNSLKHGAGGVEGGRIVVAWESQQVDERVRVHLTWRETGGPPVAPSPRAGLGTRLIQGFAQFELAGSATLAYTPRGADHTLTFNLDDGKEPHMRLDRAGTSLETVSGAALRVRGQEHGAVGAALGS